MANAIENLKLAMDYFGLNNKEIAQAIGKDPSFVSRLINGKRQLVAASPQMDALVEYILSQSHRVHDMQWLKKQFEAAGLSTDLSSVYQTKRNLIIWLASDGEELRRNLGNNPAAIIGKTNAVGSDILAANPQKEVVLHTESNTIRVGSLSIALSLTSLMESVPQNCVVDLFLSNDHLTVMLNNDIYALIQNAAEQRNLTIRMMVCVSGDTQAMSKLIDVYLSSIISGRVQFYAVHGVAQTVTNQLYVIVPNRTAVLITEVPGSNAPPVAAFVTDTDFVRETQKSFAATFRYAQPILTIYGDKYTRDVIEILAMEYCTPSGLDVVKDSINPMFMSCEAFDRFLGTRGHSPEEYAWRSAEFARFKAGMNANLQSGVPFREIISLARLKDITNSGSCRMAGLYFAELGYVDLDKQGCTDIINGYIDYLENEPNFSLLILDELGELHGNNCWHIKRDGHISINNWQGKSPVMVYSDQLMLLREFQARYDALWERGAGAIGSRANVISILKDVAERTNKRRNRDEMFNLRQ